MQDCQTGTTLQVILCCAHSNRHAVTQHTIISDERNKFSLRPSKIGGGNDE